MPFSLTRDNLILFGFGFLAFVVLSSKRIILYNEEILVALSFLFFLMFSLTYFREAVEETFTSRSDSIKADLQTYLDQKRKWIYLLAVETAVGYSKAPNHLLAGFAKDQGIAIANYQEANVQNQLVSSIAEKLEVLEATKRTMERQVQSSLGKGFRSGVLEHYFKSKKTWNDSTKKKFFQSSVKRLKAA